MEEIWRRHGNSENELDIRYRNGEDEANNPEDQHSLPSPQDIQARGIVDKKQMVQLNSDSDNSENVPLSKTQKKFTSTRKIHPSEIHFTLGDKTTKYIKTRKNVARKSLARKTKEPRHKLASQWNIIGNGTIAGYSPHKIAIDTSLRKNTVIKEIT